MTEEISLKYTQDDYADRVCMGTLFVCVDSNNYKFPKGLKSYGVVFREGNGDRESILEVVKWPEDFPDHLKVAVNKKVAKELPKGCCGECWNKIWTDDDFVGN